MNGGGVMDPCCRVVLRDATRAFDREYTYRIPETLQGRLEIGSRVEVLFGKSNRKAEAYVTACLDRPDSDFTIKPVLQLLSERPVLLPDQIRLAEKMRDRYLCAWGDALRCMIPSAVAAVRDKVVRMAELTDPADAARRLADGEISRLGQLRVVELLLDCGFAPVQEIMDACQVSRSVLATLAKNDWLSFFEQESRRTFPEEPYAIQQPHTPNQEQADAIRKITAALTADTQVKEQNREFLLFGVTGSGKTEVYLQAAQAAAEMGRGVLILVPEIGLTPQMIGRIRSRFGAAVAVLHSRLTPSERYEQWQRILRQEVLVVVGARSAVFAPLACIGLIIIDEEQETTYKSETHPRYHARDIARLRVRDHQAVLVLGSATPSVESYQRAQSGAAGLLTLSLRIGAAGMARTEIVDMRRELAQGNRSLFSNSLRSALREAFAHGRQAMLFINRRGYAGFVLCRHCGYIVRCKSCSVSMTIHANRYERTETASGELAARLICHYCGRMQAIPDTCPACGSRQIGRFGAGTQQVEAAFNREFSPYKAVRMDQDTTIGRNAHARILAQFEQGQAQVLIGTQMIAKGHDFANVTVVGILAADLMLGMSDFRSSERAFQLITQAAGRAGRGEEPGTVVIQAYNIDDYAIRFAAAQDYPGFFSQEIAYRRRMQYPPFGSLCVLTVTSLQEQEAEKRCERAAAACREQLKTDQAFAAIQIMGPAKAPVYRIRNRYRRRLIIRGPDQALISALLTPLLDRLDFGKAAVALDFDPYNMI